MLVNAWLLLGAPSIFASAPSKTIKCQNCPYHLSSLKMPFFSEKFLTSIFKKLCFSFSLFCAALPLVRGGSNVERNGEGEVSSVKFCGGRWRQTSVRKMTSVILRRGGWIKITRTIPQFKISLSLFRLTMHP